MSFRTHSGVFVDFRHFQPHMATLPDIAHHLAHVNRFGGAADVPYSVASHSVYVSCRLAEAGADVRVQRLGLLHDASEAYLGDVISGLKALLPEYRRIEARVQAAILQQFGVHAADDPGGLVKIADRQARIAEARDLFVGYPLDLLTGLDGVHSPFPEQVRPQTPARAAAAFLLRAYQLGIRSVTGGLG